MIAQGARHAHRRARGTEPLREGAGGPDRRALAHDAGAGTVWLRMRSRCDRRCARVFWETRSRLSHCSLGVWGYYAFSRRLLVVVQATALNKAMSRDEALSYYLYTIATMQSLLLVWVAESVACSGLISNNLLLNYLSGPVLACVLSVVEICLITYRNLA